MSSDVGQSWTERRACGAATAHLFFSHDEEDIAAAKAICATCPVRAECRGAGKGQIGVWGGLTLAEREGTRRQRAAEGGAYRLPKKPCRVCEQLFTPYSMNACYCSDCKVLGIPDEARSASA